jgi:hypothetical protein
VGRKLDRKRFRETRASPPHLDVRPCAHGPVSRCDACAIAQDRVEEGKIGLRPYSHAARIL